MDLSAIFLLLAVLLLIVLFVLQPLTRRARRLTENGHELSTLLAERDRLLNTLQELDFDYSLGKIPAEEYPAQRAALVKHGTRILRQMDALSTAPGPSRADSLLAGKPARQRSLKGKETGKEAVAEDLAEAVIADRRAARVQKLVPASPSDDELEDLIARRRLSRKEKIAGFCPRCGKPTLQTDAFCPACGTALK